VSLWKGDSSKVLSFDTIKSEIFAKGKLKSGEFETSDDKVKHESTMREGRLLCRMKQNPSIKNQVNFSMK